MLLRTLRVFAPQVAARPPVPGGRAGPRQPRTVAEGSAASLPTATPEEGGGPSANAHTASKILCAISPADFRCLDAEFIEHLVPLVGKADIRGARHVVSALYRTPGSFETTPGPRQRALQSIFAVAGRVLLRDADRGVLPKDIVIYIQGLRRLGFSRQPDAVDEAAKAALKMDCAFDTEGLVRVLSSMAAMKYKDAALWDAIAERATRDHVQHMSASDMIDVVSSYRHIRRNAPALLRAVGDNLAGHHDELAELDVTKTRNLITAFASGSGAQLSAGLLAVLKPRVEEHIAMDNTFLASISAYLHSYAGSAAPDFTDVLRAAATHLPPRIATKDASASAKKLADVLTPFAKATTADVDAAALFDAVAEHLTPAKLVELRWREVDLLMTAFAVHGRNSHALFLKNVGVALVNPETHKRWGEGHAAFASAYAKAGCEAPAVFDFIAKSVGAGKDAIRADRAQVLICAFADARHEAPGMTAKLAASLEGSLVSLDTTALAQVAQAFHTLAYEGEGLYQAVAAECTKRLEGAE